MTYDVPEMNVFIRRYHHDGSAALEPCTIGLIGPGDEETAIALHDSVARALSLDIFAPSKHDEIRRFLTDEGLSVGVRHEDRLICLRTVKVGREWVRESLAEFNQKSDESDRTAITGFCCVDREFRGNNVQFLSQYYAENIVSRSADTMLTTVSPKNIFSLQNLFACGYKITGVEWIYGGHLRYVMRKELRGGHPLWVANHLRMPLRQIARQQKALADGYVGYKLIRKSGTFQLLFARTESAHI